MSQFVDNKKCEQIDITKCDFNVLLLAQILCNMKAAAQANKEMQHKSLEVSPINGKDGDHPMDLTVPGPSATSTPITRSHKGNFTCTFNGCTKSFATSKYLNQHEVSHKPPEHPCTLCVPPKRFRRRSALVEHRRTRHPCKPYPCDYVNCNKAFIDSKELESHRSREHSKCFICGQTLLNSAGLKLHLRKCRLLEEVMAESDAKRTKEVEQDSRPSSSSPADQSGEWIMSTASKRSPSTGTSGYSSSPDQSLNLKFYKLE